MTYGRSGAVIYKGFVPGERVGQTPLENLLWRVKRQWHRWLPDR